MMRQTDIKQSRKVMPVSQALGKTRSHQPGLDVLSPPRDPEPGKSPMDALMDSIKIQNSKRMSKNSSGKKSERHVQFDSNADLDHFLLPVD